MCAFCVYKREKRFGAKNKNNIILFRKKLVKLTWFVILLRYVGKNTNFLILLTYVSKKVSFTNSAILQQCRFTTVRILHIYTQYIYIDNWHMHS